MASIAGLAGLGVLSSSARAQQGPPPGTGPKWNRDVDADGNRLFDLGALSMRANATDITDFSGANLSIDGAGVLNVDQGSGSGLDADTLDGKDSTAFAETLHDHATGDLSPNTVTANTIQAESVATTELSVENVGAVIYRDGRQTIPYGPPFRKLELNATEFDHRDEFDPDTNEFVAAADGYYRIDASAALQPLGPGGSADLQVIKNGDRILMDTQHSSNNLSKTIMSNSRLIRLTEGDRIWVRLKNWDGQYRSRDVDGDPWNDYLHVYRVG